MSRVGLCMEWKTLSVWFNEPTKDGLNNLGVRMLELSLAGQQHPQGRTARYRRLWMSCCARKTFILCSRN